MFRSLCSNAARTRGARARRALTVAVLSAAVVGVGGPAHAGDRYRVEADPNIAENLPSDGALSGGDIVHTVASGDSLSTIATLYGFDDPDGWRVLFDANRQIDSPDVINAGQEIDVPADGEKLTRRPVQQAAPVEEAAATTESSATSAPEPAPGPEAATATAGVWEQLARCESGGNWAANSGNGYYGGLQFSLSSWQAVGGSGYPHQASKAEQIARAARLQAAQGWSAWPSCSAQLGLG